MSILSFYPPTPQESNYRCVVNTIIWFIWNNFFFFLKRQTAYELLVQYCSYTYKIYGSVILLTFFFFFQKSNCYLIIHSVCYSFAYVSLCFVNSVILFIWFSLLMIQTTDELLVQYHSCTYASHTSSIQSLPPPPFTSQESNCWWIANSKLLIYLCVSCALSIQASIWFIFIFLFPRIKLSVNCWFSAALLFISYMLFYLCALLSIPVVTNISAQMIFSCFCLNSEHVLKVRILSVIIAQVLHEL